MAGSKVAERVGLVIQEGLGAGGVGRKFIPLTMPLWVVRLE